MVRVAKVLAWNVALLALLLVGAELGVRAYGHFVNLPDVEFHWMNFATTAEDPLHPFMPDPVTSFVHKPGEYSAWGVPITILADSTRSNGESRPVSDHAPILALGDSFTWGYEVGDADTWPAQLERAIGQPVINGGVAAYGFDQIVLRGEQLVTSHQPELVIIALIPDDIERMEFSLLWGIVRPHFTIDDAGQLVFHPPDRRLLGRTERSGGVYAGFRAVFGYSFLVHQVMKRVDPGGWYAGRPSVRVHAEGPAVACRLMPRARALADAVVLVWNYAKRQAASRDRPALVDQVSRCALAAGIEVIDLSDWLFGALGEASDLDLYYGPSHMNRAGYSGVVDVITDQLCGRTITCRSGE
jgi:hypothetical protein